MNEALEKWMAHLPERATPEGQDAWPQGWHARASWITDPAGWQAKGAAYVAESRHQFATDPELFVKAREFIRCYDGGSRHHGRGVVVTVDELLDELSSIMPITPEVHTIITLVNDLWNDPNIDPVDDDKIEFVWVEKGKRR